MSVCTTCNSLIDDNALFCGRCGTSVAAAAAESAADPPVADLSGQAFHDGRYLLTAQLGVGGMGAVYRATDTRLQRVVALKILHPELVAHPTARRRMTQEAQAMARIEHPNVVRVIDVFDEGPMLVMVLEFVTGGDLAAWVAPGGLSEAYVVPLMTGILSGLEAIHEAGLVHRDIKPGNVLLNQTGVPKITDLGVARDERAKERTRLGASLGTPEYMSPEQIQGLTVDTRSDLYAAGILLFELLTGQKPYAATSEFDIAAAHVHGTPNLALLAGCASPSVQEVVRRSLAKKPSDRFGSAREMAQALSTPKHATPASAPRSTRTAESRPVEASAPLTASVVRRARPPRDEDYESLPPHRKVPSATLVRVVVAAGVVLLVGAGLAFVASRGNERNDVPETVTAGNSGRPLAPPTGTAPEPEAPAAPAPEAAVPAAPEPEPAAAPAPEAAVPAAAAYGGDPTTGVTEYYEALNRSDQAGAFEHWAMNKASSFDAWKRAFGDQASCARVISAETVSRYGDVAVIGVDVCVDDRKAGEVHRWGGTMTVNQIGGIWKMTKWNVGLRGLCDSDCTLFAPKAP